MQIESQETLKLSDEKSQLEASLFQTTRELETGEQQPHVLRQRIEAVKKSLQNVISRLQSKEQKMKANQEASEKIAEKTLPEIRRLKQQLDEKIKVLTLCHESWERNNPIQRLQISSSRMIKVQREVIETKESGYEVTFGRRGVPKFSQEKRMETMTIELCKLPQMREAGWEAVPGEDLTLEVLNGDNSIITGRYPLAQVFEDALSFLLPSQSLLNAEVSEEEIEAFIRSLGR
jgi:hypothetical protein